MAIEDDAPVTVYETTKQHEVAVIRMALDDADIPFASPNETVSTIFPVDGMAIVSFQVMPQDAERAREAIRELGLTPLE